ncbi:hypothetical protein QEN19_000920 [Hanseniaspora menglaensis]
MAALKNDPVIYFNQYLERLIMERTQGDDVVYSLKHCLKELIDALTNMNVLIPSFNIISFMFTFMLESRIVVFKQDILRLLKSFLHIYSTKNLSYCDSSSSIDEMDKFIDCLVLNYDLFIEKYQIKKENLLNLDEKFKKNYKATFAQTSISKNSLQVESNRINNDLNFDNINFTSIAFQQQLSKYIYLQDHSSKNHDQLEFLNFSSSNNYSLDLYGETLFYLNFFNYNKKTKGRVSENNNIMFKSLNYLKITENKYKHTLIDFPVSLEPKYKAFALLNSFYILRCCKEPIFIVILFNECFSVASSSYTTAENLLFARKTMFSFLDQLIEFLKTIKLPENEIINYYEDIILEYIDSCFLLCFKLQKFVDEQNETVQNFDLNKQTMKNLLNKLFLRDYRMLTDDYNDSNLYFYYLQHFIVRRESTIFDKSVDKIANLKADMSSTIIDMLIDLAD